MKIEISQYTNFMDKQVAIEKYDGTLEEYVENQIKSIEEDGKYTVTNKFIGEHSFRFILSNNFMSFTVNCEGVILNGVK